MTKLLIILLSISLSSIAHADNSVFIEQITTSDDTTITINQDGNNNAVGTGCRPRSARGEPTGLPFASQWTSQ